MHDQSVLLLKSLAVLIAGGLLTSLFRGRHVSSATDGTDTVRGLYRILAAVVLLGMAAAPYPKSNVRLSDQSFPKLQGEPIRLSALIGKPSVINLWAAWCSPCRREMPVLRDAQANYTDMTFVFANQGETVETVQEYLTSAHITVDNVVLDSRREIAHLAGAAVVPTTLFFDRQGVLRTMHQGALSSEELAIVLNGLEME